MSNITDAIGVAYERFLMRDLTYVFSGSILLLSIMFAFYGETKTINLAINYILNNCNWCALLILLILSYFIGFITKEGLQHLKTKNGPIFFSTLPNYPFPFNEKGETLGKGSLIMKSLISKRYGFNTTRELERRIYIFHIGASLGTASLIGSVILFIAIFFNGLSGSINNHGTYFLLMFVLIMLVFPCRMENFWMLNVYENHLTRLVTDISEDKEWVKENAPTLMPFLKISNIDKTKGKNPE